MSAPVGRVEASHVFLKDNIDIGQIDLGVIKSFQGRYGIDLKEKQIKTHWTLKSLPVLSASDLLKMNDEEVKHLDMHPIEFSYEDAFQFVIGYINKKLEKQSKDPKFKGDEYRRVLIGAGVPGSTLYYPLTNLEHRNKDAVAHLPKTGGLYVSWITVILQVLVDEGHIMRSSKTDDKTGMFIDV